MSLNVVDSFKLLPEVFGSWTEVARETLNSNQTEIDLTGIPDKRYYTFLHNFNTTTNANPYSRYNGDVAGNYANRVSTDGAADFTLVNNADGFYGAISGVNTNPYFIVDYVANDATQEKFCHRLASNRSTVGSGTAPQRGQAANKWANTSNPIDQITWHDQAGSANFASGSEVVVLGWDPDDINDPATNFWEELATVNGDGTGGFSTGTITAKKYLWIQAYVDPTASSLTFIRFNSDSGSNYSGRRSTNGAADATEVNQAQGRCSGTDGFPKFLNYYVINNATSDKLVMGQGVGQSNPGAANPPIRQENVWKWDNTATQITEIEVFPNSGNFSSTSIMTVWGAD